jgi:cytochrome c-type biogenesis protein CcmH
MTLLIIFLAMTLMVLAVLLLPLLRAETSFPSHLNYDVAVHRDQLAEVERDIERSLISADQADAARTEIYRRTLAYDQAAAEQADARAKSIPATRRSQIMLALIVLILLPLGALAVYAHLGSPGLSAKPYAERKNDPEFIMAGEAESLAAQLEKKPDAKGYARLGDAYSILHRHDMAVEAYQKAAQLDAGNPDFWSELGEAIGLAEDGMVIPEARAAFIKALRIDRHEPRARFYLGLAEVQKNDPRRALAIWRDLEKDSAPDAPWSPMVKKQIELVAKKSGIDPETVTPEPPSLTPDKATEIMGMNKAGQNAAIHQMVGRLAARLKDNPDDREGWQRLAKSYHVLGETDKAEEAEKHIEELQAKGGGQ